MSEKNIYLDRNENNYGPAPACYEVLKNCDLTTLSWYTKAYKDGVKSILSKRLADENDLSEDRVLLGYGAEDLLKQVVQCYLGKDKKIMVPAYSWWYYKAIADEVDGITVEYPMNVGDDSYLYDVDALISMYKKEKPEVVFIASPNNPTGNSMAYDDLVIVLKNLSDTIVVLDEAYVYKNGTRTLKELVKEFPNLVVIRTFSKYYALAGLRIGYAVLGDNLKALNKFNRKYLGYNRLSEQVAIAALDSQDYYREIARKMDEDKQMFRNELNPLDGFKVYESEANFILVDIDEKIKQPLKEFLDGKGLIIKFMNEAVLNKQLRISLGTQEENRKVVDAIKEFANKN